LELICVLIASGWEQGTWIRYLEMDIKQVSSVRNKKLSAGGGKQKAEPLWEGGKGVGKVFL
jgi:hypothetical protein